MLRPTSSLLLITAKLVGIVEHRFILGGNERETKKNEIVAVVKQSHAFVYTEQSHRWHLPSNVADPNKSTKIGKRESFHWCVQSCTVGWIGL